VAGNLWRAICGGQFVAGNLWREICGGRFVGGGVWVLVVKYLAFSASHALGGILGRSDWIFRVHNNKPFLLCYEMMMTQL
jgi:hypothetical protein